ncbi:hypothetical protein DEU56DRAFT_392069 [Suillus clintonianus]|uniref:uncharacterized protein n=1 Tax=Suillus clintonianus TaxID=1904413 RepID=UPI001B879623|nr:uncharacterized protein DEU56DRAFT_392069 [Suillus clintonianus]KAG2135443.1 hypothetical protein DEU56DRAFT_392069 [Suillus clintonianus]
MASDVVFLRTYFVVSQGQASRALFYIFTHPVSFLLVHRIYVYLTLLVGTMHSLERSVTDFNARLVIGPIQVGGLLSAALFGCLACQSYVYFARFTNDHLTLKAAVSAVMLIQLGHFVCMISTLWTMTVSTYGNPSRLRVLPLAADLAIPLSAFTAFIVQTFYAFRLWRLSENIFLPVLCETLSVVAQVSTLILSPRAFYMTDLTTFEDSQIVLITLSFVARATCDVVTSAAIAWSLNKKRINNFGDTMTMIDRLVYWTIETGLATSLMAVITAVLFLVLEQNFVWFGAWLMLPNVVGNSLLASFNRRLLLREAQGSSRSGDTQSRNSGLNTLVFKTEARQPQAYILENFKNRDIEVFQDVGCSIDQESRRVSRPAVVHLSV